MKEYLPLATVVNEDGSVVELRGERTGKMYDAFRMMKEWADAYGERLSDRRIEVWERGRVQYTIRITETKKGKRG